SVTAALLREQGYEVIGITMQIWHRSSSADGEEASAMQGCCTIDAVDDARRVASQLGIPYYVPNFREEFSDAVVDDFAREYREGRTPNPCVRCNQFVRFDGLIRRADELGIDYVATGHYARVNRDEGQGEFELLKGIDPAKDQSYMLHTLQQRHLRRMLLPLGGLTKSETRALARYFNLTVAEKPDSQEICFVAGNNYKNFLKHHAGIEDRPGEIVDTNGRVVGSHVGIHGFTVGQRKGLGLAAPTPRYVIELQPVENRVVIGERSDGTGNALRCTRLSFVGRRPHETFSAGVKIRYHSPDQPATVSLSHDDAHVAFERPVWGIAPGQLAVFYQGDRVLGGGTITEAERAA
ncbi:MAG: tRNA 2-thiouridine(34) synthase MnmA, partial [Chloroflexota bacterium]